jgi:hypothetical protein
VDVQQLSFEGDKQSSTIPYLPHLARLRIGEFGAEKLGWEVLLQRFLNSRSEQQNFNISKRSYNNSKRKSR